MLQNKEGLWITSDMWSFTSKASKESEFVKKKVYKGNKNIQIEFFFRSKMETIWQCARK